MTVLSPEIPTPDRTITLTAATEAALSNAIDQARAGEVTKIVLPQDQIIHFTSSWATKNITGKDIVIDFNGATIKYDVDTGLSFHGSYDWTKAVSSLSVSNGDTVLNLSGGVPSDLQVGDWLKIVSDDTTPGDRATNRYMGEALQIKAIVGNTIYFDGELDSQQLYQTNIRAGKYADGSVILIDPSTVGTTDHKSYQITLKTMIGAAVISPDAHNNGGPFVALLDTVGATVTDPSLSGGNSNLGAGFYPYGVEVVSSTRTTILDEDGGMDVTQIRHAVDAQQPWVTSTSSLASYGASHGIYIKGLDVENMFAGAIGSHSGGRGMVYDDVTVRDTSLAITIRGQNQVYKDLQVINVDRGIQFYNESNQFQKNGSIDAHNIYIIGGYYDVKTMGFFTSGLAGDNLVDDIHFQNTTWNFSGTGWFSFLDNAKGDWSFVNDTIKLTGTASTLMRITGSNTHATIDGMVLDLTDFKGSTLKLFDVDSGSRVDVTHLTIINPHNVKIVSQAGSGEVHVAYGDRIDHALPDGMLDILSAVVGSDVSTAPPAPTDDTSDPPPPSSDPAPTTQPSSELPPDDLAVYQGSTGVVYDVTEADLNSAHTIYNLDNTNLTDGSHDFLDVSRVFELLGGKYTDGVNDVKDRAAAVHLADADLDGDGKVDDISLTIDGLDQFKIELIDPKGDVSITGVSWGGSEYDDVNVLGRISKGALISPTQPAPDGSDVSSDPAPTTQPGSEIPLDDLAVYQGSTGVVYDVTEADLNSAHTIYNFDNTNLTDGSHDFLDVSRVFELLGGKYTDGVNDVRDRAAAVHLAAADLDGDGKVDDISLTIDGLDQFKIEFIDPKGDVSITGVSWGGSEYDDVNVLGRIPKGALISTAQPAPDGSDVLHLVATEGLWERFTFIDPQQKAVIENFDSRFYDDLINDVVDLRDVFKALGGSYTDGVHDAADRAEAVVLTKGDFNNDGMKDDVQLTINGASDFSITFIHPTTDVVAWFDFNTAGTGHDDILIA